MATCLSSFLVGSVIGRLVDGGFANSLALESLEHGTNLCNYLSIRILGGDPQHGGKSLGSTKDWKKANSIEGYFFLFKDRERCEFGLRDYSLSHVLTFLVFKYSPASIHCYMSGYNLGSGLTTTPYQKVVGSVTGVLNLLVTPTLRFRFCTEELEQLKAEEFLKDDCWYSGMAYKTTKKVEAYRAGFLGSFVVGINRNLVSRVQKNPRQVAKGVLQVAGAIALTVAVVHSAYFEPLSFVTGLILS